MQPGKLMETIRENREFLLASLAVALLFILPHLVAMLHVPGYDYFSTQWLTNDEFVYAARLEAFAHFGFAPDVANYEHQGDVFPVEKLPQAIFLPFYLVSGGNLFIAYLLLLFVFGFLLGITSLKFISLFFENRLACILIMLLMLTSINWFYYFPPWGIDSAKLMLSHMPFSPAYLSSPESGTLTGTLNPDFYFPFALSFFERLYYQLVGYPLLFLALYLLVRGYREENRGFLLRSAAIFGIFAYLYFYFFAVGISVLFIFFAYSFIKKDARFTRAFAVCAIVALALSFSYVSHLYNFTKSPAYADLEERFGSEFGRLFKSDFLAIKFVLAALLLVFFVGGEAAVLGLIVLALILPSFAHAVAGKTVQIDHFYSISTPFFLLACILIAREFAKKHIKQLKSLDISKYRTPILSAIALLLLFYMAVQVHIGYNMPKGESTESYGARVELFKHINQNLPKDAVLLSLSPRLNVMLSANTARYLFLPNAFLTPAPTAELQERMVLAYRYCNAKGKLESVLKNEGDGFSDVDYEHFYFFHRQYQCDPKYGQVKYCNKEGYSQSIDIVRRVPKAERDALLEKYDSLEQDALLKQDKYKLDYMIISSYERSLGCPEPKGEEVFSSGTYSIIKLSGKA